MLEFFFTASPVEQALYAGIFTWALTALGAGVVFLTREFNRTILDAMLGFAAGIMIAASFWSLLLPAIEISAEMGWPEWLPASAGFLAGAVVLGIFDKILPHLHLGFPRESAEGVKTEWHRSTLLVMAITLHNIPEGLAVGVAFGALAFGDPHASLAGAVALAIGIGLQNFPEGIAVSVPLRGEGFSARRSFWYGQLSGLVEPAAALLGASMVVLAKPILPFALAFAAGAMIFVVVEELIPESQIHGNEDIATFGAIFGFLVMMVLDVGLS